MGRKKKYGLCATCSTVGDLTREHVPPKAIFSKPRPEPIIVWTCFQCNNGTSEEDDILKVILALGAKDANSRGYDLKGDLYATIDHNARLRAEIIAGAVPTHIYDRKGHPIPDGASITWNARRLIPLLQKIGRCLHYDALGCQVPWNAHEILSIVPNSDLMDGWKKLARVGDVGGENRFHYLVGTAHEYPMRYAAIIQYVMYGRVGVEIVYVEPKGSEKLQSNFLFGGVRQS